MGGAPTAALSLGPGARRRRSAGVERRTRTAVLRARARRPALVRAGCDSSCGAAAGGGADSAAATQLAAAGRRRRW